jgi:hypothetical protein
MFFDLPIMPNASVYVASARGASNAVPTSAVAQWFAGATKAPPLPDGWLTGRTIARVWRGRCTRVVTRVGGGTKGPPMPAGWVPG